MFASSFQSEGCHIFIYFSSKNSNHHTEMSRLFRERSRAINFGCSLLQAQPTTIDEPRHEQVHAIEMRKYPFDLLGCEHNWQAGLGTGTYRFANIFQVPTLEHMPKQEQ